MAECPDETTLSDFLAGLLPLERRPHVLAHVEGCASCQWVLAASKEPPPPAEDSPPPVESVAAQPLARGSKLSRYVVLERIGSGAMGEVYAAYDPELDRQVALKVLHPEGRHEEALQRRLLLEAQALARLSHPNVVAVYDVGMYGDGIFLAMELGEGSDLQRWLEQPRSWTEVLKVFQEAGRGLAAAHKAGLVHRDFKPANVLVGQHGRVWVTDFGLARPPKHEEPPKPRPSPDTVVSALSPLTLTGALVGTPAYMAPEQFQGKRADALSDQFSFCVTLHEGLYGVRPFEGTTVESLAQATRQGKLRPPPRGTQVPSWVRRVVLRGLQPEPEQRFPSMEALLAALAPRARSRRARVVATAVVACLLGAVVAYGVAGRREARCAQEGDKVAAAWGAERRERVHKAFLAMGTPYAETAWEQLSAALDAHAAQWRTLRTESCMAAEDGTSGTAWQTTACLDTRLWQLAAVTDVLEKVDDKTVQNAQQLATSLEGLSACKEASVLSLRPQPPDALRPKVDELRRKLAQAQAQVSAARYSEGVAITSALLPEVQKLEYRPLEAEVLLTQGKLLALDSKPREAEEVLYKALWSAEAGRDDMSAARAWILLLWVVGDEQARVADVERFTQHAQAQLERLGRERVPALAEELHERLGSALLQQGKFTEAEAEFTQGLELSRKLYGPENLHTAGLLHQLARVRYRQVRPEDSLGLARQSLAMRERLLGPQHPHLVQILNLIALDYLGLGRQAEAIATWRRALAIQEASPSAGPMALAVPLLNIGDELRVDGQLDEARRTFERVRSLLEPTRGPDDPSVAIAVAGLSLVALDEGKLDEALSLNQDALSRFQRKFGPDSPRLAEFLRDRAKIHGKAGRYAEARQAVLDALKLLEKAYGVDSNESGQLLIEMAAIYLESGAPRESLEYIRRSMAVDEKTVGAESRDFGVDLVFEGEAWLALGNPKEALPKLERARKLHQRFPGEPMIAAWGTFLLAKALADPHTGGDRARAAPLAEEARVNLERLGPSAQDRLKKVVAWQRGQEGAL